MTAARPDREGRDGPAVPAGTGQPDPSPACEALQGEAEEALRTALAIGIPAGREGQAVLRRAALERLCRLSETHAL